MALVKSNSVSVEGLAELQQALQQLPRALARMTLRRVLKKAGEPIAQKARALASEGPSKRLRKSIAVSSRLGTKAGKAEFAAAMRQGLGKQAAVQAMRDARRAAAGAGSFAEMYVGPGRLPYAHMIEFGTVKMEPQPYMRPAWEQHQDDALRIIKDELWGEIAKTARRYANKKLKTMLKG